MTAAGFDRLLEAGVKDHAAQLVPEDLDLWPEVERRLQELQRRRTLRWRRLRCLVPVALSAIIPAGALVAAASPWMCAAVSPAGCGALAVLRAEEALVMDRLGVATSSSRAGIIALPTGQAIEVTPPAPFRILLPYYLPTGWILRASSYYPGGQSLTVVDQPASTGSSGTDVGTNEALEAARRLSAAGHPFLWLRFEDSVGAFIEITESAAGSASERSGMSQFNGKTVVTMIRAGTLVEVEGDAPNDAIQHVAASLE